jgi:hypothetical protein
MSYDKQKVIDLAWSQIGYHEKETNSQLDDPTANAGDQNWNKYARDLDKLGGFYNGPKNIGSVAAWCDIFVDWLFVQSYGRAAAQYLLCQPDGSAGAGSSFSAQYFNSAGCFHKSGPETGDQIFFGSAWNNIWHTGLVVAVSENYVTTIEGNTSDMVAKRIYKLTDPNIFGYGRPRWGTPDSSPDTSTGSDTTAQETPQKPAESATAYMYDVKLPLLMIGDRGGYVKAAQALLIAQGYDCGNKPLIGTEKPDGDFGRATERAVGFFQSKHDLELDGEIGGQTWAALLKFD